jgi:hypothetical protein
MRASPFTRARGQRALDYQFASRFVKRGFQLDGETVSSR